MICVHAVHKKKHMAQRFPGWTEIFIWSEFNDHPPSTCPPCFPLQASFSYSLQHGLCDDYFASSTLSLSQYHTTESPSGQNDFSWCSWICKQMGGLWILCMTATFQSWRFKPVRLHYITAPLHSAVAVYTMFWPTQTSEMMGTVLPSCPTWALTLLIISPLHTAADWPKVNPEMSLFCLLTSFHAVVTFGAVCGIETPTSGDGWNHTGVGGVAVDPAGLSVARLQWGAAVHWMGDSWGLRTSAGEQFGSFAASWA